MRLHQNYFSKHKTRSQLIQCVPEVDKVNSLDKALANERSQVIVEILMAFKQIRQRLVVAHDVSQIKPFIDDATRPREVDRGMNARRNK